MGMAELQAFINQADEFRTDIERMHVQLQYLSVRITELENATEMLQDKKEQLDKDKKMTAETNEDLERTLKAKEEANQKRLLAKL